MLKDIIDGLFDSSVLDLTIGLSPYGSPGGLSGAVKELAIALKGRKFNDFDGTKVGTTLVRLARNPRVHKIEFGMEYSPVIYVHVHLPYLQNDQDTIIRAIMTQLRRLGPDELDVQHGNIIRAWWD